MVYGISYPERDVYDNLVSTLGEVEPDAFTIGLLHANVEGNAAHALYAPCSLGDLEASGIDYWALGHVHTRDVMRARSPAVVYPGNPQGRHVNETGARGVYLVEVDGDEVRLDFRAMDTVRWARIEVDASSLETDQELRDSIDSAVEEALEESEGRDVVCRISIAGRTALRGSLRVANYVEQLLEDVNTDWASRSPFAWCERIEDETTSPIDRDELLKGSDFLAEVLLTADKAKQDSNDLARFRERLTDLYQHHRYRRYLDASGPADDELQALLDGAESLAVELLAEEQA